MARNPDTTHHPAEVRPLSIGVMLVLATVVGIASGYGSIAFRGALSLAHNLFFTAQLSLDFETDAHISPPPWGPAILFIPVLGAILVTWITNTLAPETRGHGVPEVMNAIYYDEGRIRPIVVLAKALSSAISIGTGGSVGREGPIIQIGSAFGSALGQVIRMPAHQRIVLVGAGAAGGIAATFNAPVGGLAFAIELMLVAISAHTVSLVAISTVVATYISRMHYGVIPSFHIPELQAFNSHVIDAKALTLAALLGVFAAIASTGFIRLLYWSEDFFERVFGNPYIRHMLGMFIVGAMMYGFQQYAGYYYVGGVGYSTIGDVLSQVLKDPGFLLMLFAAKLLATCLTLGSGASGGVFSPSLFLGATMGSALANLGDMLLPGSHIDPIVLAVAGMAAMVSSTTGAIVTAVVMIFEQTRDYAAILPIMMSAAVGYLLRTQLLTESIYTLKLARRGRFVPKGLQAAITSVRHARTLMSTHFVVVEYDQLTNWVMNHQAGKNAPYAIVVKRGEIYGLVAEDHPYLMDRTNIDGLISTDVLRVSPDTTWSALMRLIRQRNSNRVLVAHDRRSGKASDVLGVITTREIVEAAHGSAELIE